AAGPRVVLERRAAAGADPPVPGTGPGPAPRGGGPPPRARGPPPRPRRGAAAARPAPAARRRRAVPRGGGVRRPPPRRRRPAPPRLFDRALHRKRLDRAARDYANADFLQRRAAHDVAERLAPIMQTFPLAVDLSARGGAFAEALAVEAPGKVATLIEADLSHR